MIITYHYIIITEVSNILVKNYLKKNDNLLLNKSVMKRNENQIKAGVSIVNVLTASVVFINVVAVVIIINVGE
ncbi:hypothetical protein BLA29_013704 [Euroglyphus maynei]|uniref:Uncharacterized protein n=1 Tax=Euroglyphus maynei TaxID=6958 RepID=A0A1Y3BER1_EURMA|nr:hypothetical protein BLA29_013704 [Euroglyphus maynei]